jgi:RNA polymerase sigma-70 factor, ECF subfamily
VSSNPPTLPGIPLELTAALASRLEEARRAYPGVALGESDFYAHVLIKLGALGAGATLSSLRTSELFLARAVAGRDVRAIAFLERDTFGEVDAAFKRFQNAPISLDDVKQRLREKLVLAEPAGILGYAGTGALRGWMRAAALHLLLNVTQRETREAPADDHLIELVIGDEPSAEAAYMKLACRAEFEAAFSAALGALSDRDRGLLRYAFVDRRSIDEIGAIYGVHRATAARWVAGARGQLVDLTRADLMRRLAISDAEAKSIIVAALSGVGSMLISKIGPPRSAS